MGVCICGAIGLVLNRKCSGFDVTRLSNSKFSACAQLSSLQKTFLLLAEKLAELLYMYVLWCGVLMLVKYCFVALFADLVSNLCMNRKYHDVIFLGDVYTSKLAVCV